VARPPHYARICWTKPESWFEKTDPVYFATEFFDLNEAEQSTYEVWNEIDEARAAAAHMLSNEPPKRQNCYIIRFCEADVTRAGARVVPDSLGRTGIIATIDTAISSGRRNSYGN
jgi:hypothetical protein